MELDALIPIVITAGAVLAVIFGLLLAIQAFYVKVPQGTALIINDMTSTPKVRFTGGMVWPVIHKKELMKISLITLEVARKGNDGLICLDNMRADIIVAFYLRVNETQDDVLRVAKSIGVDRASTKEAVSELFSAKFSEALKTVGKQIEFEKLFEDRQFFRDKIIETIGNDMNGYALEDVAIDYLEQTPKESLDPNNILDAQGIRKITELTAEQNVRTNELERNKELAITKKNVETREAMLELERQQADAEARQQREIAIITAREEAETRKVQEEERLKSETARIATAQDLQIREENRMRETEVAEQNRQRAVAIEQEKVTRARDLEIVARQRDVELQEIEKEKALEVQRKEIANVVRERVAVDKTVAEEEERIKEVRELSAAQRSKQVHILAAEADAQEILIKDVKTAEADEIKSKHRAAEINTIAAAELEAAARQADAKKKLAEGVQAEVAAPGLAEARVKEANADALEREGLAEARVTEQKLTAQARGDEEIGLAVAKADEAKGMAAASVIRARFMAEAEGLVEKFNAMNVMSEDARAHEEFRMQLEKTFEEAMAAIAANEAIARDQARAMEAGLKEATIDIVGGQGDFFDTVAKGLSLGRGLNGFMEKSPIAAALARNLATGAAVPAESADA